MVIGGMLSGQGMQIERSNATHPPADESRPMVAIVRLLFQIIRRQEIQGLQDLFFCQLPVY
jgi:hypothetical protein